MNIVEDKEAKKCLEQLNVASRHAIIDLTTLNSALNEVETKKKEKTSKSESSEAASQEEKMNTSPLNNIKAYASKRIKTLYRRISRNNRSRRYPNRRKLVRALPLMELKHVVLTQVPPADVWPDTDSDDSRLSGYISDVSDFNDDTVKQLNLCLNNH